MSIFEKTMKKVPNKKHRVWQTDRLHAQIKLHFKRQYKTRIVGQEIQRVWNDYIAEEIIKPLSVGSIVELNDKATLWVKATPILEHKTAMSLFKRGLMLQGGKVVPININFDTSKYIYDIVYENKDMNDEYKLYFKPHPTISKGVHEGIKAGKLVTRFEKPCQ